MYLYFRVYHPANEGRDEAYFPFEYYNRLMTYHLRAVFQQKLDAVGPGGSPGTLWFPIKIRLYLKLS